MKYLVKVWLEVWQDAMVILLGIYAYVILMDGVSDDEETIKEDLKKIVKEQIGSFAVPHEILVSSLSFQYCKLCCR